ncbi:MAG: serine hydrolase, partial [Synechocystis sp.]
MKKIAVVGATLAGLLGILSPASLAKPALEKVIQANLEKHYTHQKENEYFSAIQLSTHVANQPIQSYVVGTVSHDPGSPAIASETLFQIGSITKSFTAALLLLAEGDGQIKLQDS